jgi:hypothetical protein
MKSHGVEDFAITRQGLLATLERVAAETVEMSVSERALFATCEFWSAIESRSLRQYLGTAATEQLRYISVVYTAIGANEISRAVDETLAELNHACGESRSLYCIARLQERLRRLTDPLIDLLARCTKRLH